MQQQTRKGCLNDSKNSYFEPEKGKNCNNWKQHTTQTQTQTKTTHDHGWKAKTQIQNLQKDQNFERIGDTHQRKNDQTNPPMNSQRNKNETLNRWKELALFCSRNLGGWWIGGGISMTSGSMVLPEGSILWLFVPQQERRNKAKEKSEFEGRVNVHAGVILLCRNEKERESVWKLKIEERETKTKRETLVSVALIDRLMKRKFKKTLALLL